MSAPIDAVISALKTIPDMSAKIYHAQGLKNASAPFIFWIQQTEDEEQALDGYTGLKSDGYEIHVVTENVDTLNTLSESVKTKLIALQGTKSGEYTYSRINIRMTSPVLHEKEVELYRKVYLLEFDYTKG